MLGSVRYFSKFVQLCSRGGLLLRRGDWAERVIPAFTAANEHLVTWPRRGSLVEHLLVDCKLFVVFKAATSSILVLIQNV